MNISVMLGSLRKDSYNRKLFELYRELSEGIFVFNEIPTADFPLYNADLEPVKPDIIEAHATTIRRSDGIIFISPEYNYSIPGNLKNAIDCLSRVNQQPFDGKKAAIIGGSPGAIGTARMQYELRKVGVFLNINFLNKPEVMVSNLYDKFDQNGNLIDEKTVDFFKTHIRAFAGYLKV